VEKDFHPNVQEQGKGKEQRGNKEVAAKCDRLDYFVVLYFPQVGYYRRTGVQMIYFFTSLKLSRAFIQ
jgi:hypothetical protein